MTPVVEVDRVSKSFGAQSVLQELSFSIERGEIFCLLGPNGAGKTTTLEILEGFLAPDTGAVRVLGQDPIASGDTLRRRVGVVLQESGFPKFLRVGEMIETWRSYYDDPLPYDEILDLVGLRSDERKLVRKLSGGQRRRLDFALAVAGDPEVIFLDEPTTGFDPEARARCWETIVGLRDLGKTVLLTTHYLDEAEHLADRIAVLWDGAAGAIGSPQEAHVARQMGLSRGTVAKWWHRWLAEGEAGLVDRSSRPRRCPRRTDARLEERVCRLRRSTRRGPVYLGARTGLPASTVWRILKRNGLNRLSWIDRPTGRVIRRYERSAAGELVHLDIKKVGKIPPGGGWRVHGRGSDRAKRANRSKRRPVGYTHLHVAIDDYSRVA